MGTPLYKWPFPEGGLEVGGGGGTTGEALTKGPLGDGEVGKWGRKGKVKREPPNQK
jgi:hypothetical protein